MSQQTDPNRSGGSQETIKATAATKRENADFGEANQPLPWWVLGAFGVILILGGVHFGIYHGGFRGDIFDDRDSSPELLSARKVSTGASAVAVAELSLAEQGKAVYSNCQPCHQANGQGVPGQFPTLVGTEWVTGSEKHLIAILLKGLAGPLKVGDAVYNGAMPAWEKQLSNKKIAAVASYVRSAWGNTASEISEAMVAAVKKELSERNDPWSEQDLRAIPTAMNVPVAQGASPAAPAKPAEVTSEAVPGNEVTKPGASSVGGAVDLEAGKGQYMKVCVACHQPTGLGLPPVFPPLVNSEYVKGNPSRLVAIILNGVVGPIEVDGKPYNNIMPPQGMVLKDKEISQVASFVRSVFGGGASPITEEQVISVRAKYGSRTTSWTEAELKSFPETE